VGVRFEVDTTEDCGREESESEATVPAPETVTIETGTLSVESTQIKAVSDDETIFLRWPNE
jgi:hypothetical protein